MSCSEVTIVGDGRAAPEVIAGDKLTQEPQLQAAGRAFPVTQSIAESRESLTDKLWALQTDGPTALGPGLLVSVSIAAQRRGSTVIVCTDGLANVGVGALDVADGSAEQVAVEEWYQGVGELAKLSGTTVSVISLRGDECALEDLGRVAEATGGTVDRVDPLQLAQNFGAILAQNTIATNVQVWNGKLCVKWR
jgi:Mg-chelatase subunit ChlD